MKALKLKWIQKRKRYENSTKIMAVDVINNSIYLYDKRVLLKVGSRYYKISYYTSFLHPTMHALRELEPDIYNAFMNAFQLPNSCNLGLPISILRRYVLEVIKHGGSNDSFPYFLEDSKFCLKSHLPSWIGGK